MKITIDSVNASERDLTLIREPFGDTVSVQVRDWASADSPTAMTVTVDAKELKRAVLFAAITNDEVDGLETFG